MLGFNRIENLSDQLGGYAQEVEREVSKLVKLGYSKDQAIKIIEITVEDMKVDTMHEKNEAIYDSLEMISESITNLGD